MFAVEGSPATTRSDRKTSSTVILAMLIIILLSLILRLPNLGHTLSSDEAYDSLSVYERVEYGTEMWDKRMLIHPPLYLGAGIAFGELFHPGKRGTALVLEMISLLASLGVLVLLYFIGKDWFDRKTGLLAAFFYAVLPAARVYDTWVKQDVLMLVFVLLFLLLFFRKKYIAAGIFLGLALLTKEPAAFMPLVVGGYLLIEKRFKEIGRLVEAGLVAAAMSFWWYAWVSTSKGNFLNFFAGKGPEAEAFRAPWHWFVGKAPVQLGWIALLMCLVGLVFFIARFGVERRGMLPFVLLWVGLLYAIFSASAGKPVWMIVSVLPAVALLSAWGLARAWGLAVERNEALVPAAGVAVVLALAIVLAAVVPYSSYMKKVGRFSYDSWESDRKLAESIDQAKPQRITMYYSDATPTLFYYMDAYDYATLGTIMYDGNLHGGKSNQGVDNTVILLDDGLGPDAFIEQLKAIQPGYLLVRPNNNVNYPRKDLIEALKKNGYTSPPQ